MDGSQSGTYYCVSLIHREMRLLATNDDLSAYEPFLICFEKDNGYAVGAGSILKLGSDIYEAVSTHI